MFKIFRVDYIDKTDLIVTSGQISFCSMLSVMENSWELVVDPDLTAPFTAV